MNATGETLLVARFTADDGEVDAQALRTTLPSASLYRALDGKGRCLYAPPGAAAALAALLPPGVMPRRLACTLDLPGIFAGRPAPWHYVVETDVLPAFEDEFNAWYDSEHLPGLAAVPGTVRAWRLRDDEGSPRYRACYELETMAAFNSPAWLAVRATPWSSRVRPAFRRTTRTMFTAVVTALSTTI